MLGEPNLRKFGYETVGANRAPIGDRIRGTVFTIPHDGMGESITACIVSTGQEKRGKCAIYRYSDYKLIAVTEETIIPIIDGWVTFNFAEKPNLLKETAYVLVVWATYVAGTFTEIRFDAASVIGLTYSKVYNSFPDPFAPTQVNHQYSIYCSYTPIGITHILRIESTPLPVPVELNSVSVGITPVSIEIVEGDYNVSVPQETT